VKWVVFCAKKSQTRALTSMSWGGRGIQTLKKGGVGCFWGGGGGGGGGGWGGGGGLKRGRGSAKSWGPMGSFTGPPGGEGTGARGGTRGSAGGGKTQRVRAFDFPSHWMPERGVSGRGGGGHCWGGKLGAVLTDEGGKRPGAGGGFGGGGRGGGRGALPPTQNRGGGAGKYFPAPLGCWEKSVVFVGGGVAGGAAWHKGAAGGRKKKKKT